MVAEPIQLHERRQLTGIDFLDRIYIPEIFNDVIRMMDTLSEIVKEPVKDFPPLLDLMDDLKTFMEAGKDYIDKIIDNSAAEISDYEKKLSGVMEQIAHLEVQNEL